MNPIYGINFQQARSVAVDSSSSSLNRSVVPVLFRKDGQLVSVRGSAFCLAALSSGEAIFATAKHVISEYVGIVGMEIFVLLPRGLATAEERKSLSGVSIPEVSLAEAYSDVALFAVDIKRSEIKVTDQLAWLPVTFGEPRVGQHCLALGYPQRQGLISYELLASDGVIEEVHPTMRDGSLSTFPSFRTTAAFRHGMSGGPIINEAGKVIGIISHGTEADDPSLVTGYGASIGAIIELKINLCDNAENCHEYTIPQLAEMGILAQSDEFIMTLVRANDGVTLTSHPNPTDRRAR